MKDRTSPTPTACLERVTVPTLRRRITERIRQAVLSGSLREGERLVERKLALQLGTSLSALREALVELETEGFITKKPNSATYVTKLSWPEVERIFALRRVLESYAAEQAAVEAAPGQLQALEQTYRAMTEAARTNDTKAFNEQDVAFHLLLWRSTRNEFLEAALRRAVLPFFAFVAIRIVASRGPVDLFSDAYSHRPILEALKSRDPAAARAAFLEAIEEWHRAYRIQMTNEVGHSAQA